jgi:hypothetical protein
METYDVDFHTLYVNIADHKKSELQAAGKKHPHHQPSNKVDNPILPPPWLLSDGDHIIGGDPYQVKKVRAAPLPSDFTFDNITYLVKTADLNTYHVSSTQHSGVTSALVDQGANGGITGSDCCIVKVNDQPQHFVNVEGIDGDVMERRRLVTVGSHCHAIQQRTRYSSHESICSFWKGTLYTFLPSIGIE